MMNSRKKVTVFAPATSANIAVGFDILGFAVHSPGDRVILKKSAEQGVRISSITGEDDLPYDGSKNTATIALQAMLDYLNLKQGFTLRINKQIPLSSGLGGSAACSVAAVVALNQFLLNPLPCELLVSFALQGEQAACGVAHGDNVIPCLYGGMTLIQSLSPLRVVDLPAMALHIVLFHPHIHLATRDSRAVLPTQISLNDHVRQSGYLGAFITALYEQNYERLASACRDELIESMRAPLIPGFYEMKSAALHSGAMACSISGSGPTLFALAKNKKTAQNIAKNMGLALTRSGVTWDVVVTSISPQGARVVDDN